MVEKTIFNCEDSKSIFEIRDCLSKEIINIIKNNRDLIILCIGTDRSTGDSLGPLVGDKLKFLLRNKIVLLGNLENPIHAKNICKALKKIKTSYNNPYIIAIDASLGSIQNVGNIIIESKPILPGSAMNKNLPPVGDLSITGIVNVSGTLEFMVLQNTRLFTVMKIADIISKGLYHSIIKTMGTINLNITKPLDIDDIFEV
ncbi:spore protease YyaC [Clostridium neuense]|uniref:Spore protease YyaC n=1 Tax=Clostridium neuense TaxID=1728934 RepID=A0ABW8TDS0_9CLOT